MKRNTSIPNQNEFAVKRGHVAMAKVYTQTQQGGWVSPPLYVPRLVRGIQKILIECWFFDINYTILNSLHQLRLDILGMDTAD
jgi:hypothetical protein